MWNKFKLYLDKMGVIRGWGVDAVGVEGGQGGRVQLLVKGTAGHRYNLHLHEDLDYYCQFKGRSKISLAWSTTQAPTSFWTT